MSWWLLIFPAVLYVLSLVGGSIILSWNFYLKAHHAGTSSHQIALTFDDGPASETNAILDILKELNVPAAFFSIGKAAAAHPETVRRWHAEGHLVGNHSYFHKWNFDLQSRKQMKEELQATNEIISNIIGQAPAIFRPPYGVTNPNLAAVVKQSGMSVVGWSVRSFDTVAKDPQQLLERILKQLKGGDIVLLHDSMPITREILTPLIIRAREKGFTFVRVDQLLQLPAYA